MNWAVIDSLYCAEQFFCSHLDSYSHYLNEFGETADAVCLNIAQPGYDPKDDCWHPDWDRFDRYINYILDVAFFLDGYQNVAKVRAKKYVAQVAALCPTMPWDVRKPDGSCAFDLILSSIPALVERGRATGARCEYMPLAFDLRARSCMMGVKRDINCLFIGTRGPNHKHREQVLHELEDVVTVLPPVFGRAYFKTLARAKVVLNVHSEWAKGAGNNMRLFEAAGMGCEVVSDGEHLGTDGDRWWFVPTDKPGSWEEAIHTARVFGSEGSADMLLNHTYECADRVPRLVELVRSL